MRFVCNKNKIGYCVVGVEYVAQESAKVLENHSINKIALGSFDREIVGLCKNTE